MILSIGPLARPERRFPPLLALDEPPEGARYLLLTDAEGRAVNARVLDLVELPVEVTGELVRSGEHLILRSDPETWRRLER